MATKYRKTKLVPAAGSVEFLINLDGRNPVTLYLENVDLKAALVQRTGGTDPGDNTTADRAVSYVTQRAGTRACLAFENVTAGAAAAVNTIEMDAAPNQAFSIDASGDPDFVIHLACDSEGNPVQLASEVLKAIEDAVGADADAFRAAVTTTLAPGSDGSAPMARLAGSTTHVIAASTDLLGGSDASVTGDAHVFLSAKDADSDEPPFVENLAAGVLLSAVAANTTATVVSDDPTILFGTARGLKVVVEGVLDTWVTLSVIG